MKLIVWNGLDYKAKNIDFSLKFRILIAVKIQISQPHKWILKKNNKKMTVVGDNHCSITWLIK